MEVTTELLRISWSRKQHGMQKEIAENGNKRIWIQCSLGNYTAQFRPNCRWIQIQRFRFSDTKTRVQNVLRKSAKLHRRCSSCPNGTGSKFGNKLSTLCKLVQRSPSQFGTPNPGAREI